MAFLVTYYGTPKLFSDGTVDWDTSTICAALFTSLYIPSRTHATWADLVAGTNEVVHAGYTAGGNVCTSPTLTNTTTNTSLKITVPGFTPTGTTMDCRYMIFYKRAAGAVAGTDKILGYVDLGATNVGIGFTLTVAAPNGWWNQLSQV